MIISLVFLSSFLVCDLFFFFCFRTRNACLPAMSKRVNTSKCVATPQDKIGNSACSWSFEKHSSILFLLYWFVVLLMVYVLLVFVSMFVEYKINVSRNSNMPKLQAGYLLPVPGALHLSLSWFTSNLRYMFAICWQYLWMKDFYSNITLYQLSYLSP